MDKPPPESTDDALIVLAQRYRDLLESGPIGVFEIHRDGTIRYANVALARSAGYASAEAMVGANILRHYVDPTERDRLYGLLATQRTVTNFPVVVEAVGGEIRHLLLSVTTVGEVTRGLSIDVTELRRKERELAGAVELNRRIFEAMPGGVVHVLADGSIHDANPEACRILGLSFDELTQRYTRDFETETIHEDGSTCSVDHYPVSLALTTGETQPPHIIGVKRPDGQVSWAVFRAVPLKDAESGDVTGAVVTFFDITARKAAEDRLRMLEERMRQAQKLESLGLLAGGVAHDFNNLLTAILGNASLAKIQLPPDSEAAHSIAQLELAAQRAADLTRQMLTYAGRGRVEARLLDLSALVGEMAELLSTVVSKRAKLELELGRDTPPIEGDAAQLQQVIMNLILNASEALGDAQGTIQVRVGSHELSEEALRRTYVDDGLGPGEYVFLEVADSGAGMDATTRARVFDPFFTTKTTGRGLGLAATLGIVRGHRGAVELASTPGAGTVFRISFPVSKRTGAVVRTSSQAPVPVHGPATVLVIDDESAVRNVARGLLVELGYEVLSASGGREGIEVFSRECQRIDVVLLDLTMSDLGGGEVLDELTKHDPEVRVVLFSGYSEEDVTSRVGSPNLVTFLQKPFSVGALVEALELARRR